MRKRTYQNQKKNEKEKEKEPTKRVHFLQFDYISDFWCLLNHVVRYFDENWNKIDVRC